MTGEKIKKIIIKTTAPPGSYSKLSEGKRKKDFGIVISGKI